MLNSKMYKKYYPIKSSFDIANMNVAEQKKLIYWIKSLSEDIRLHNTNSLKKAMQYRENEYHLAMLEFRTARNEDEQWEARKTMARLEQIAAQEYGFAYADELHEKEIGRKGL